MKFSLKPFRQVILLIPLVLLAYSVASPTEIPPTVCDTEVDLREQGQVLAGYPISHQGFGTTNLCGFFAASTLADAWRVKHQVVGEDSTSSRINPVAVAVELAKDKDWPIWVPIQNTTDGLNNRSGRWGSVVCRIADYLQEHGACADEAYSRMDWKTQGRFADKNIQLYKLLFNFGMKAGRDRQRELDEVAQRVQTIFNSTAPLPDKPRDFESVKELISANQMFPYRTMKALMHPSCDRERLALRGLPSCKSEYYAGLDVIGSRQSDPLRTDRALQQIHSLLNVEQPMPVAIAYCGRIMREGRSFSDRSIFSSNCSPHWALIIGRKKIGGQCHLLVRNSSSPEEPYSSDWVRDGMDVWIEAKALQRTIYAVQWLKDDSAAAPVRPYSFRVPTSKSDVAPSVSSRVSR